MQSVRACVCVFVQATVFLEPLKYSYVIYVQGYNRKYKSKESLFDFLYIEYYIDVCETKKETENRPHE